MTDQCHVMTPNANDQSQKIRLSNGLCPATSHCPRPYIKLWPLPTAVANRPATGWGSHVATWGKGSRCLTDTAQPPARPAARPTELDSGKEPISTATAQKKCLAELCNGLLEECLENSRILEVNKKHCPKNQTKLQIAPYYQHGLCAPAGHSMII